MALQTLRGRDLARLLAVGLALAMVATVGLVALPMGQAPFVPPGLTLANSKYWGGHTFVPGEMMTITVYATAGDSITITIQDTSGNPTASTSVIMGSSAVRVVNWTLSSAWPDAATYQVSARDTTSATNAGPIGFTIRQYNQALYVDRRAYLPGDQVTINWAVVFEQNYTPAPAGAGALQVHDGTGANLLATAQYNLSLSQSSYRFTLSTAQAVPQTGTVDFWFNDTAGLRFVHTFTTFRIGTLGITVTGIVGLPAHYHPGDVVTATVQTRVTGVPGNPFEPNVPVDINVTDLGTGTVVTAYSAAGLTTDGAGLLTYSFLLAATPTTADYELSATATSHGVQSANAVAGFSVQPPAPVFTVSVSLDKSEYRSGDTIHATVHVVTTETLPLTYSWVVTESPGGRTLASQYGGTATTYDFAIPLDYQTAAGGFLTVTALVNDGNGTVRFGSATATVALGYLNLNLNKPQFNPNDVITATYSLSSLVMTNPSYLLQIVDSTGTTVQFGPTSGGSATYTVPANPATSYTFTVIASDGGMSLRASATANQASGYYLSLSLDRSNYVPGDTIGIAYTVTARGPSALPSQYEFNVVLVGTTSQVIWTTSPTGTLSLVIPPNTPTGTLLLTVSELSTGTTEVLVVHVGGVNPLVADIGGVPLFDILITLLFVVLLLAVILLWRRAGMGKGPGPVAAGKPSTPPPPPPSGPSQQVGGPMSVACKHCGATIEITTSKRPIEVMCPSCGETQVVQ